MFFRLSSSCLSVSTVFGGLRRFLAIVTLPSPPACAGSGVDHLVELAFDLGLEVGLDLVDVGELGEGPAAVRAEVVHAGTQ